MDNINTNGYLEGISEDTGQNNTKRTIRCQNCKTTWKTEISPNSFTECPHCNCKNNSDRRVIFYFNIETNKILLD